MSSSRRGGDGGSGRRGRDVPEEDVQDKLSGIRARRAQRAADRVAPAAAPDFSDDDDDGDEATAAFNIADFDLPPEDDDDPTQAGTADALGLSRGGARRDIDDDDGDEATAAFSIDSMGDLLKEDPPARASAPSFEDEDEDDGDEATAAFNIADMGDLLQDDVPEDDGDEATAAFSIDDMGDLLKDDPEPAPAPAPRAAPAPRERRSSRLRRPGAAAPPRAEPEEEEAEEKTAAFSLDDIGDLLADDPPAPAARSYEEPEEEEEEERTAAINLDTMGDLLDLDDAPSAPAAALDDDEDEDEEPERTMAVSLDDLNVGNAPAYRPAPPEDPDEPERTMAVSLADFDIDERPNPPSARSRGRGREPEPAPEPDAELVVVVGQDVGKRFSLTQDKVLVGRGLDADFVVSDASTSRRHFQVVRSRGGSWKLVDLGSGNGTRVDGERVNEIVLQPGMKIECGQVTMEFQGPGAPAGRGGGMRRVSEPRMEPVDVPDEEDKTRMGDMAALEIDPDWASRAGSAAQPEVASDFGAGAAPPIEMAGPAKKGGAGKTIGLISGLLLLGGGGFVAADKFGGLGIIFPKDAPAEVATGEGPGQDGGPDADAASKAAEFVMEGELAYSEKRWHEARKFFKDALALDRNAERENGDPVDEAALLVDQQLNAWNLLVDAQKATQDEDFARAHEALTKISVETAYYKEAQDLLKTVRGEYVGILLGQAREAEDKGDYEAAKGHVAMALKVSKDDTDAQALSVALERATAPDADNLETDAEDPAERVKPEKVAKADMAKGLKSYADGDFAGAINFFDGIQFGRASRRDRAKAKALSAAITQFETVYRAGSKALNDGNLDKALADLRRARKFDAAVNRAYQAELGSLMADVYGNMAKKALDAGSVATAGGHAQRALKLDKANFNAGEVMKAVKGKVSGWLADAQKAAASQPDRAMGLLAKIVRVLPEDDADYKAAYKLLNELAKAEDD